LKLGCFYHATEAIEAKLAWGPIFKLKVHLQNISLSGIISI